MMCFALDSFGITQGFARTCRARLNPMSTLKPGSKTLVEDAALISEGLVVPSERSDSHWDETGGYLLETLILHVALHSKYRGSRNLITVY